MPRLGQTRKQGSERKKKGKQKTEERENSTEKGTRLLHVIEMNPNKEAKSPPKASANVPTTPATPANPATSSYQHYSVSRGECRIADETSKAKANYTGQGQETSGDTIIPRTHPS